MEDLNSETDTNIASNKDFNSSTNTFDSNLYPSEKDINIVQNLSSEDRLNQYKPEEITLNQKIILDSITLYNTISTNYGEKKLDITRLSKSQQEKALIETELLLLNGKKIVHISSLDKYINLKELYLNQNYINEIKGLDNLKNLQVLNLSYNNIKKIENIIHLNQLQILDLSNNLIEDFDINLIPKDNIVYMYMYYNPFFKKMKFYDYRSLIIINFNKIERIDKLQITDRERLLLIDETNLKYENRLKSLEYIIKHYKEYNKNKQDIFNMFKQKIDSDINNILNKKKIKNNNNNNNTNNTNDNIPQKYIDIKNITTTNEPHNDIEDKKILKDIKELKDQSEKFFNESILSMQNRKNVIVEKYINNQKKFKESETVKKLQAQIDLLNEKFKKANFIDPEIKKKFEERIKDAIKFKERITHAEELTNKVIDDFNKKENKQRKKKERKELESIPEEDNKKEELNEIKENKENKLIKEINEIKLEDSDSEEEEEDDDEDDKE